MDAERFDRLARTLASRPTRRRLLKTLLGFGGAAATAGLRPRDAGACAPQGAACSRSNPCCAGRCSDGVCACPANTAACSDACVKTQSDSANCGACGNLCAGGQVCRKGVCACPGQSVLCNGVCVNPRADEANCGECGVTCVASSPCTEAICRQGTCRQVPRPNGSPCDDGDACTQTDTCQYGDCVGANLIVCTAIDQCHGPGVCDPATGICSNPNKPNGVDCNDGNACTAGDTCQDGVCTGGTALSCTSASPCTVARCDPVSGCVSALVAPGVACGDGDPCNGNEVCDGAGNCVPGTPVRCDPCNRCDLDTGACVASDDGLFCPGDGKLWYRDFVCRSGACVGIDPVPCSASDQCHDAGTCDPKTGLCSNPDKADGTTCDDGNACTRTATCRGGVCTGGDPVACTALDGCHDPGMCDPATGICSNPAKPDGAACDDGNACTRGGVCVSGSCLGADPVACHAPDACHDAGTCDPVTGRCSDPVLKPGFCAIDGACVEADRSAPDNPCLVCDPILSATDWSPAENGTRCSDSDACTDTDTCQTGVCTSGTAITCSPGPCQQSGACNPETGACEYVDLPDGTACEEDGDLCTLDICMDGACIHPHKDCDDGIPCTIDSCDPETGACLNTPLDCDDGNACTIDTCVDGRCEHEPLDCEGEDPCVTFGCDPEFGCLQEPLDCADEDLCTTDSCDPDTGTCKHDSIECGDGPPCSSATCDPDIGCVYNPKECPAGEALDTAECRCKPRCTEAQTQCGGACVDLKSDDNNCGGCGNVCEPGPDGCVTTCVNGRCDWIPMNCAPSDTPPGVNVAACCVGNSCCIGTQTACCLRAGHICWSEGNTGHIVHCSPP